MKAFLSFLPAAVFVVSAGCTGDAGFDPEGVAVNSLDASFWDSEIDLSEGDRCWLEERTEKQGTGCVRYMKVSGADLQMVDAAVSGLALELTERGYAKREELTVLSAADYYQFEQDPPHWWQLQDADTATTDVVFGSPADTKSYTCLHGIQFQAENGTCYYWYFHQR